MADNDLHIVNEISNEGQENVDNPREDQHPWPYLESLFQYKGKYKNSVKFICRLCSPLVKEISAFISSPSNLRKHVEVSVYACVCLVIVRFYKLATASNEFTGCSLVPLSR